MGKEYETVEVFQCPECGNKVFVEWDPGETSRKVACSSCYIDGGSGEFHYNAGELFTVTRQGGLEFQERVIDHDLGRDTGPVVTKSGISDPGINEVLHSTVSEVV